MLTWVDYTIVAVYLASMVVIGIACRGRQEDVDDYFTTHGGMGSWFATILVGFSIAATLFSGISFIAFPSITYSSGTKILFAIITFLVAWLVVKSWFLPRYFAAGARHPYEVIEKKNGLAVRLVAAGMFVMLRIGWMAALIYAPTVAIRSAAGLDETWFWPIVLIIGISSTVYTTFGGIRGVIVTDAIQFVLIAVGVAFTIGYAFLHMAVPFGDVVANLREQGLLNLPEFTLDFTQTFTFWTIIVGWTLSNLGSYTGDQMSLQRYLACGSAEAASRSFLTNVLGAMVVLLLLGFVGLTMAAFYDFYPDSNLPERADEVFPYYIASQLPTGIAGLLLAAILAATMSSMTSGINALSSTLTLDFRNRLFGEWSQARQLRFSRVTSFAIGMLSTSFAGVVGHLGDIFDIARVLLDTFLAPLMACMVLSLIRKPLHRPSIIAGMLAAWAVCWALALDQAVLHYLDVATTWITPVGLLVSFSVPLIGTAVFGASARQAEEE